jgi:hypothetical protein
VCITFWKQFCSFDTVLGKNPKYRKSEWKKKERQGVQLRHIQEDSA